MEQASSSSKGRGKRKGRKASEKEAEDDAEEEVPSPSNPFKRLINMRSNGKSAQEKHSAISNSGGKLDWGILRKESHL